MTCTMKGILVTECKSEMICRELLSDQQLENHYKTHKKSHIQFMQLIEGWTEYKNSWLW